MRICAGLPYAVSAMLAEVCQTAALKLGIPMSVALVDAEGGLQFFSRMDGTLPVSTDLAVSKAYTAAVLRMPTHELGELAQPGGKLYGIQYGHNGKIVLFGGGFPLRVRGIVVGAVGVSGGTVEEDMRVATSATDLLAEMDLWLQRVAELSLKDEGRIPSMEWMKDALDQELRSRVHVSPDSPTLQAVIGGALLALG
jgi:uncharacterized protein GlcG (DUF336 family)